MFKKKLSAKICVFIQHSFIQKKIKTNVTSKHAKVYFECKQIYKESSKQI